MTVFMRIRQGLARIPFPKTTAPETRSYLLSENRIFLFQRQKFLPARLSLYPKRESLRDVSLSKYLLALGYTSASLPRGAAIRGFRRREYSLALFPREVLTRYLNCCLLARKSMCPELSSENLRGGLMGVSLL